MLGWIVGLVAGAKPLEVGDETFQSRLLKAPLTFVFVDRPHIAFCRAVMPAFLEVAERIGPDVQFLILAYYRSPKTRQHYAFFAYPSLVVFRGADLTAEYIEDRNVVSMVDYLRRITGPAVVVLGSARAVHDFVEKHRTSVILATEAADEYLYQVFTQVAKKFRDTLAFAYVNTADAIQQLGVEEVPSLRLHRNDDRQKPEFPLAFGLTEHMLTEWIFENQTPRYWRKDAVIFRDLMFDGRYTLFAFVDSSRKASLDSMHQTMQRAVAEFGTNLTYVYSDIFDMRQDVLIAGFTGAHEPVYLLANLSGGKMHSQHLFPERRRPTPDNIVKWLHHIWNETLSPQVRSEQRITDQTGPFLKLVGSDFRQTVMGSQFDVVLLVLIGSQRDRSRAFETTRRAAVELERQKVTSVKFYHIDFVLNDLPGFALVVSDSSMILLWPAGELKEPFMLRGNISWVDLIKAIGGHAKTSPTIEIPGTDDNNVGL
jgi:thiol-disulfide isomerase/thioredoxin